MNSILPIIHEGNQVDLSESYDLARIQSPRHNRRRTTITNNLKDRAE